MVTAFATPNPDYNWYNPKGELLDPVDDFRFKLSVDAKHQITLTIQELQLSDMGHYTLEIEVDEDVQLDSKEKEKIDMYLNIISDPVVKLSDDNSDHFFMAKKSATLTCEVEGYPIDENSLVWKFR